MVETEVVIVGGGPGGSSCAQRLVQHGVPCLVLDRACFPRTKLCAGWITPDVIDDLDIDLAAYPHGILQLDSVLCHLKGMRSRLPAVQYSIRRYEFDAWLLERSGASVVQHKVERITRGGDHFEIDGQYRCRYLVGAGGTSCPVHRNLFRVDAVRQPRLQAVALEEEFPCDWSDGDCRLWFLTRGLPGYAWYVPKANGWLNIGVGGSASLLKERKDSIRRHWDNLVAILRRRSLVPDRPFNPVGYGYYARGEADQVRLGNAFLVGDSAGLATRDLCEGIGPAVRSGLIAADSIALGTPYTLDSIARYSGGETWPSKLMDYAFFRR